MNTVPTAAGGRHRGRGTKGIAGTHPRRAHVSENASVNHLDRQPCQLQVSGRGMLQLTGLWAGRGFSGELAHAVQDAESPRPDPLPLRATGFTHLFPAKMLIIKNSSPAKAGAHCAAREFYQVLNRRQLPPHGSRPSPGWRKRMNTAIAEEEICECPGPKGQRGRKESPLRPLGGARAKARRSVCEAGRPPSGRKGVG